MKIRLPHFLSRLGGDRSGAVLLLTAISLPLLLGFVGLAVDGNVWYANKRIVQTVVDSGALAAALEMQRTGNGDEMYDAVALTATANGYDPSTGDVLQINQPPLYGAFAGNADAVEVVMERAAPTLFSGLFVAEPFTISAHAVAMVRDIETCVSALDPTASGAIMVSGGAEVTLACAVGVNSSDDGALTESGRNSCLTATKVMVVGGMSGDCIETSEGAVEGANPVDDPFATLEEPSVGPCDHNAKVRIGNGDVTTLSPGVYCGGIEVVSGGNVTFSPGLYVIDGGGFKVAGNSSASGTDVTFFITEDAGSGARINFEGGAEVSLSAPTDGYFANGDGILFYQDQDAPSNITHHVTGGATMELEGILYFPNQEINFAGGATTSGNATMLVARQVKFTGDSNLSNLDGTPAVVNPLLISAVLVE